MMNEPNRNHTGAIDNDDANNTQNNNPLNQQLPEPHQTEDINAKDFFGCTQLHRAVKDVMLLVYFDYDKIQMLISISRIITGTQNFTMLYSVKIANAQSYFWKIRISTFTSKTIYIRVI